MSNQPLYIDNLQYANWSPALFKEMKAANLAAVGSATGIFSDFWATKYCTMQRNGRIDFFYRLPAPPTRLDLSQDVLRTTECASDRSGDARFILGRVVKSPAARARRTLFSTKIVRACTILVGACTSLLIACTSFSTCTSLVGAKY